MEDHSNRTQALAISNLVSSVFEATPTTGVSIIAGSRTELYYEGHFGTVHSSSEQKITANTLFDIQSITKVVATMSLLEKFLFQGKIALTDRVKKYIPELSGKLKTEITIQDLALHRSGISDDDFGGEYKSPNELWDAMFSVPVRFVPGTSIEYTDVGYRLLGLCLERVGAASLDNLCKTHLWHPLGMKDTSYDISSMSKEAIAGPANAWGAVDDAQDRFLAKPLGCDGVFTNSKDLTLFCRYWLEKLSDAEVLDNIMKISDGVTDSRWSCYESLGLGRKVFGWEQHDKNQSYIGERHTNLTFEKAGGAGAFICIRPERQDFFIYLTNHGRPDPFSMDAWNNLVATLRVTELAKMVLTP